MKQKETRFNFLIEIEKAELMNVLRLIQNNKSMPQSAKMWLTRLATKYYKFRVNDIRK